MKSINFFRRVVVSRVTVLSTVVSHAILLGPTVRPAQAEVLFTDVSEAAGLGDLFFRSQTAHSLGINWIDYDKDGWPDLFLVGGNAGNGPYLLHNNQNGTFTDTSDLLPSLPAVEMSGSIFADFDRDGDDDLFIYTDQEVNVSGPGTNPPDGPLNLLLRNLWMENGQTVVVDEPLFEDVTAAAGVEGGAETPFGILPGFRTKTAGWVDYDRDGCIDLYAGNWVHNSGGSAANRDIFYRNLCDGTFEDATVLSGVNAGTDPTTYRATLAFIAAHLDGDLWPDLYAIHTSVTQASPYVDDFLFRNNGPDAEGTVTFSQMIDTMPGVGDDCAAGMGIDVADIDLDGDWDIYISDLYPKQEVEASEGNVLYLGNGDGTFADNSATAAGVKEHSSWGIAFFDVDHDGFEDLHVATVGTIAGDYLYMNDGDGTFSRATDTGIDPEDSRGTAVADFDRDGDLDLAVVNQYRHSNLPGIVQLFRNDTTEIGNWLQVKLTGTTSNLDAIGAVVKVQVGAKNLMRQVLGGSSAHSQDSLMVHFGLGDAPVADQIEILWPSGEVTWLKDVGANQWLSITEPLPVNPEDFIFTDNFELGNTSAWNL